jgi:hypothetical protein
MTQPSFYDLSPDGLQAFLQEIGEPAYRVRQIRQNVWSRLLDDAEIPVPPSRRRTG